MLIYASTSFELTTSVVLRGGKLISRIAPVGHSVTHLRQSLHFSKSIYAKLSLSVIASLGHDFTHFPHPIQATEQFLREIAPFSLLIHETKMRLLFGPLFLSSIMLLGQAFTHAPHDVHLSSTTTGSPVSGFMYKASNWQESTQSPQPKHPNGQPLSPEKS